MLALGRLSIADDLAEDTTPLIPNRPKPLLDKLDRLPRRLLVHHHQMHALPDQPTAHADIDHRLLSVPHEYPYLDPCFLERVDRVGHAVLEPVFDRGRPEEEHVFFNEFGGLVEGFTAAVDGGCCLGVFCGGDIAVGNAQRAEAFRGWLSCQYGMTCT